MKIVIAEPTDFSEKALQKLHSVGEVALGPFTREKLSLEMMDAEVLILRLGHVIDIDMLSEAKKMKFILTPTTGLNHIDTDICKEKGITIFSLFREEDFLSSIPSTAEHTWALLLSLIRKVPSACDSVKNGFWDRDLFKSHNLNALSIGILGLGRVGKQIAKIATAFNMNVYGYDSKTDIEVPNLKKVNGIHELMKVSDILSIHVNLTPENKHLINSDNLQYAKSGMYVINTSRGELIKEEDLVSLLELGVLGGVAVDVLDGELNLAERNKSVLLKYARENDNVIITPHIAGATQESMWMTEDFVVDKFLNVLKKKE